MSRCHNDAGEPLMTDAQARLEAEIDEMNAAEDAAGLNLDPGERHPSEEPCVGCGDLCAPRWLNVNGYCPDCLESPTCPEDGGAP